MRNSQLFEYFQKHANGNRADRMALYMVTRELLVNRLRERGFGRDSEHMHNTLREFDAAVVGHEDGLPAPAPVTHIPALRFWRRAAVAASILSVALIASIVTGTFEGSAQTPAQGRPAAPAPAAASVPASRPQEVVRPVVAEVVKRFTEAETTFPENTKVIEEIASALNSYRQRSGRYPESAGTFVLWPTVSERHELLSRTPKAPKTPRGTIIYRSDGAQNYKLLMVQTGDCVVALLQRPEMVDTPRSGTLLDCTYYGKWTPEAAAW
jgi:hypothetical protein